MMRSLFSGVSGLRVHQTKMDVLAHNISNVNTVGYKSSRVTFSEVFSQTLSGASRANDDTGRGGTNPMQIGLGSSVASIDKVMTTGASQRTDRSLDLMIQDDGFFVVSDATGTYFTKAGAFDLDVDGNLVMPNGMRVMGWDTAKKGEPPTWQVERGMVTPIVISGEKEYSTPTPTTYTTFEGNLNRDEGLKALADPANKIAKTCKMDVYDSLGNRYVVDVNFTLDNSAVGAGLGQSTAWNVTLGAAMYLNDDRTGSPGSELAITQGAPGDMIINFDTNGNIIDTTGARPVFPLVFDDGTPGGELGGTADNIITLDFSRLTQYGKDSSSAKVLQSDGNPPGALTGMSVGGDGIITGRYSNGDTKPLGQVVTTSFKNPAGLEKVGNNLFVETPNSGTFDGVGTTGSLQAGVLEMSNVDLSQEFTEMITTQRGFQASSRIISTSDDMLQELVNLKR